MANSGSVTSNTLPNVNLYMKFEWYISNIDADAGTCTLNYKLYGVNSSSTNKFQAMGDIDDGVNWLKINNSYVYRLEEKGSGSRSNPYATYTRLDQDDPTRTPRSGTGSFSGKYILCIGLLVEGTKTLYYDDDGNASFTVEGIFNWYWGLSNRNSRSYIDATTFTLNKINRYSKAQKTTNSGSSWSNSGVFAWKTTDRGQTWTKCNLYKTTNNGSTWTKIT